MARYHTLNLSKRISVRMGGSNTRLGYGMRRMTCDRAIQRPLGEQIESTSLDKARTKPALHVTGSHQLIRNRVPERFNVIRIEFDKFSWPDSLSATRAELS